MILVSQVSFANLGYVMNRRWRISQAHNLGSGIDCCVSEAGLTETGYRAHSPSENNGGDRPERMINSGVAR